MSHVRQQIRDEIVARLSAIPQLSGRVEASRVYTAQATPYVIVYTHTEEAASDIISKPSTSGRELTVHIEIYSKAGSGEFDDQIDTICALIEAELQFGVGFEMCQVWEYRGVSVEYSKDGDKAAGVATLEYMFAYRVREDDSETGV